jgi:hypothetical protein
MSETAPVHSTVTLRQSDAEFRQAWIIALRSDIADYVAAAELWFGKWDQLNSILNSEKKGQRNLGSGLIDHSQNMTAAAMQIAEK